MHESRLKRITLFIIALIGLTFIVIQARSFLVPLVFATFFALMLLPLAGRVQKLVRNRILAIFITLLLVVAVIMGIASAFSLQLVEVFNNLGAIGATIRRGVENLAAEASEAGFLSDFDFQQWVEEHIGTLLESPLNWLQQAVLGSTNFIAGMSLTAVYLFFMLLYAHPFRQFLVVQAHPNVRDEFKEILKKVQNISLKYLLGMFIVILILGTLNSLGLYLIGVDFAVFWGFLAAFLVIIPYIGTFLGGLFPFLYSIPTSETWLTPILVIALFIVVQFVEGNFITPKIVGSSVSINPLTAIVALVMGGVIWGIPGMILAIPITAVIKIFFSVLDPLKPLAILMGDDPEGHAATMEEKYGDPRFSIWEWLTRGERDEGS